MDKKKTTPIIETVNKSENKPRFSIKKKVLWRIFLLVLIISVIVLGIGRFDFFEPKNVEWMYNIPIAHRGLHTKTLDENSLGAFQHAIDQGYAIELDVRLSGDGVAIVFHDRKLAKLGREDLDISRISCSELKNYNLPLSQENIPTLAEALELISGKVPVLIEIKNYGFPGFLEKAVHKELVQYNGDFAVQSYNPFVCRYLKKLSPEFTVGLLLNDVTRLDNNFSRNFKDNVFALICRPNFIAYNLDKLNQQMLYSYREYGVAVLGFVYAIDELRAIEKSEYLAIADNVIFEIQ